MFQSKNKVTVGILLLFVVLFICFYFFESPFLSNLGKDVFAFGKENNNLFSIIQKKVKSIFASKKDDNWKEQTQLDNLSSIKEDKYLVIDPINSKDSFIESEEELSKYEKSPSESKEELFDIEEMFELAQQEGHFIINLPKGNIEENYYVYLDPPWGEAPYKWRFEEGALPEGIQLDAINGILYGIPEKGGIWDFVIKITDARSNFILIHYYLIIVEFDYENTSGELNILTEALDAAFVGVDYFIQISATGGSLPYSWSVSLGLPSGLNLERTTGIIYGVPQNASDYNFSITVTDSEFKQASQNYNIEVDTSPLYITTTSLPDGTVGVNYYQQIQAQGGKPPYIWQIISGIIPEGIVFETETATLSGIPQSAQSEIIRIKVTDSENNLDIAELRINISGGPLSILTTNLNVGEVGTNYYEHLYVQGGIPPYNWAILSGNLPEGIEFQNTGILIGTPLTDIESDLLFQVVDDTNNNDHKTLNLTILGGPLTVQTVSLQEGSVGIEFYQQLEATGGIHPYSWSIQSGELPEGISLSPEGILSGTPTNPEIKEIEIKVTDSNQDVDLRSYVFIINADSLMIITQSLDVGILTQGYNFQLQAIGGISPYHWRIIAGNLPQNLELSDGGVISGVPEEIGIFPFEVEVFDDQQHSGTKDFHLDVIEEEIEIITTSLPEATVGISYETSLEADGGVTPYLWSIFSGGLPNNLQLNGNTGVISGTPTESGSFSVAFKVIDTIDNWTIKDFNLTVQGAPLSITTENLANGLVGIYYEVMLEAEGGSPPYDWQISSGELPEGLALNNETGIISGRPVQTDHLYFTVQLTDQNNNQDSKSFDILTEAQPLVILTENLPEGRIGMQYSFGLEASGGQLPYVWNLTSGQLPQNLTLNNTTGIISGIPLEQVENLSLTFQVIDIDQQTDEQNLFLTINSSDLDPITGFIARGSDEKIGLAWVNPQGPNFDYVKIIRNALNFPQTPDDGTEVYTGINNNIVDSNLDNEVTYYYTAFAFDDEGGYTVLADDSNASATPHEITLSGQYNPCVDEVISFEPLDPNYCYGMQNMPDVVLGSPIGGGEWSGSLDVVSLHARVNDDGGATPPYGGSIILRFTDNVVVDSQGPDFTIFENAFHINGTDSYFMEPAVVDVSQDGIHYYRFSFDYVPHYNGDELDFYNPYSYAFGFAGIKPVYSYNGDPDPTDPSLSGGDRFDLTDLVGVNLTWIQYVKITSTGDSWLTDINGDLVRHSHEWPTWACSGTTNSGFDLDAVIAINY